MDKRRFLDVGALGSVCFPLKFSIVCRSEAFVTSNVSMSNDINDSTVVGLYCSRPGQMTSIPFDIYKFI